MITVETELLVVVSSGTTALLQVLLFRAWLNACYPQHAKSLAALVEQLRQQQHNALMEAARRAELARFVLRLHELDGKLDGLCNDLNVFRQCLALAVSNGLSSGPEESRARE